jgi:diguanylate cyclase (GGDEF)-like protein
VTKPFQPAELRARVRAALRTKRYHDLLSARAQLDGLTGLWNRSYFDRRIHEEMLAVQRYGRVVSLVLMDLDHFKRLNDAYGHPFGDLVLQRVGEVLLATLREVDAPCRYGGEEFALVLTETALPGALTAVRRIREQLEAIRLVQKGETVSIRASFGVSSTEGMSPPTTTTVEKLVRLADEALYAVKREGRDGVRCAAPAAS